MSLTAIPPLADEGFKLIHSPTTRQLKDIFTGMQRGGYIPSVFYGGEVTTHRDFVKFATADFNHFYALAYEGTIEACAWLNSFEGRTARVHFSSLPGCPMGHTVKHGINFTRWVLHAPDPACPDINWLNTLCGVTPASNKLALRFIKRLGFVRMGEIPEAYIPFGQVEPEGVIISKLNRRDV